MSAPTPATRRSGSGSRRFNPLRVLQPKRRMQQLLSEPRPPAVTVATAARGGVGAERGPQDRVPVPTAPVPIPVPAAPAFDYCRFIELDYVPMETGYMVSMRPTKNNQAPPKTLQAPPKTHQASSRSPTKGFSERHNSAPCTPRSRRTTPPGGRELHGNSSLCSSSSGSGSCKNISDCSPRKGGEFSPTKGRVKMKSCTENHGIRPPPPEQYLTPLQQKEVCIRHLRSKLKETIDTLQNRDCEVDELRERLFRMQEDWVEEECHRVEAQLALKEARAEIQALKRAVDGVRERMGDTGDFQDINSQNHRLESLLLNMEMAQGLVRDAEERAGFRSRVGGSAPASVSGESPGALVPRTVPPARIGSCSCEGSPARSITRSSTYTKLTERALADKSGHDFGSMSAEGTQDSGFVCCGESSVPSRADLLLEAAYLSEETASLLSAYTQTFAALPNAAPNAPPNALPHAYSQTLPHSFPRAHMCPPAQPVLPHSSTCEGLCSGEHLASLRCSLSSMTCMSHPCLSHHHLFLHPLREAGIQTESCPIPAAGASDLDTIAEARTFRSQACSPTSTWASDDGEELESTASLTTATVLTTATEPLPGTSLTRPAHALPRSATVGGSLEGPLCSEEREGSEASDTESRLKSEQSLSEKPLAKRPLSDRNSRGVSPTGVEGGPNIITATEEPGEMMPRVIDSQCRPTNHNQVHSEQLHEEYRLQSCEKDHREKDHSEDQSEKDHSEKDHRERDYREKDHRERDHRVEQLQTCDSEEKVLVYCERDHSERDYREKDHRERDHREKDHRERDHSEKDHHEKDHSEKDHHEKDHSERYHKVDRLQTCERDHSEEKALVYGEDMDLTSCTELEEQSFPALSPDEPLTSQPRGSAPTEHSATVATASEGGAPEGEEPGQVQRSYWSRHFLVDLLAVAIPVVPTVAWLCRGPGRDGQPMYHIGSLLRGCCTVALTSLRRSGGMRHYPAGGGGHI